ncbi:hypothetical protein [Rhizobium sp. ERR 1071]|uniref:hypothetical protein n=1 Tax=Rhizobium sp. ERR 1071 TaxID=2572677 RepID=UPI00119D3AF2|nr:hypothetical protein [Rhizobium sp. ERR1071]
MSVIMPIVIRFLHASRRLGAKMCIFMTGVSNQPGVFCGDPYAVSHKMAGSLMKMGRRKRFCGLFRHRAGGPTLHPGYLWVFLQAIFDDYRASSQNSHKNQLVICFLIFFKIGLLTISGWGVYKPDH